jgi:hypothetical protein
MKLRPKTALSRWTARRIPVSQVKLGIESSFVPVKPPGRRGSP